MNALRTRATPWLALMAIIAAATLVQSRVAAEGPLGAVSNVTVASGADGELTVTWDGGENADRYIIWVDPLDGGNWVAEAWLDDIDEQLNDHTFKGLPGGTYGAVVIAIQNDPHAEQAGFATNKATVVAAPQPPKTCSSGVAVPDRGATLVAECELLLAIRDAIVGTGSLDWTTETAMSTWEGVTVSGGRVTALSLASKSLSGRVSALVGELTGLTELRISGNSLTGRLPSKLGQLTALTHAYIAGNAFDGCAPPLLRTITNNDVAASGLVDCAPAKNISDFAKGDVLAAGTYYYNSPWDKVTRPLIFDIPPGMQLRYVRLVRVQFNSPPGPRVGDTGLILRDTVTGSSFGIDVKYGGEWSRWIAPSGASGESGPTGLSESQLFDRLSESLWYGR